MATPVGAALAANSSLQAHGVRGQGRSYGLMYGISEKGFTRTLQRVLCTVAVILLCAGTTQPTTAATLDGIDLPEQYETRYKALIDQLRCLVCQNETLADSDAELAADLRREIREKMVKGESDKEITVFLVDRYGDFVLYNPPVKSTTLMLWYGPFALLALGILIAVITIRRRGRVAPPTLSTEHHKQVQDLLRKQNEGKGS